MTSTRERRRLLFLIRSLEAGGTERQLTELLRGLDCDCFDATVATLYHGGAFVGEVTALPGVTYRSLGKRRRWDGSFPLRLAALLRELRPHVLSSYLGAVNEAALVVGSALRVPVVWNIRNAYIDGGHHDWFPRAAFAVGRWLSRWPALVVFNSAAGLAFHQRQGYRPRRAMVIRNGIDLARYRPDALARAATREAWGIDADECVVGVIGRLNPIKDHPTFLRAAAELARRVPRLRVVCVGAGPAAAGLATLGRSLGLGERVIWAGFRADMAAVYNALDLLVSSSRSEGFSNAIAEAMACATTCVATDVGDSCEIVGDTGTMAPPGDPTALAAAMAAQLARPRERLGAAARERIRTRFSLPQMVRATEDALESV